MENYADVERNSHLYGVNSRMCDLVKKKQVQDRVYRLHLLPKNRENMKKCTYLEKWKNILKCNRKGRKEGAG